MMNLLLVAVLLVSSSSARAATLIYHGPGAGKRVTLTFDAGADRGYAARILSTLESAHVRATFGMTGAWARANPDLVKRMARDGDTFVNHTYDHKSFTGYSSHAAPLGRHQRMWEITQTEKIIHALTGKSTKPYFRPPYGDLDSGVAPLVGSMGYSKIIMWTVDSLGWDGLSSPAILARCLSQAQPGAIFLMHVGSQSQDAIALPAVIRGLKRGGYKIVTLPKLLH